MHKQIYVNLAVADLPRSRTFFERLGLGFEPRFSNDRGACLVLGDNLFAMLLTKDFFRTFTTKPLADPANAWSGLAREQLAIIDLRQGKVEDARKTLQALSIDIGAPSGLRARASALLAGLGPQETK